eukprot:GHVT01084070.1.p1 GENE.GHVT01084070.1~~GHVT01084070.1.p1  ORF type:complete len:294 (+),score=6.07 GHVT01084070.1:337-1218(+)
MHGDIAKMYTFEGKVLGTGFSGPVRLAVQHGSGRKYAVKPFHKLSFSAEQLDMLRNEAQIYLMLDHPNVARLIEVWEDDSHVFLVMEHCSGGELYDRLCSRTMYTESHSRSVTLQMLSAVQYLHAHNIVHRDLKLENWLYVTSDDSAHLKLIDFGFSKIWDPSSSTRMQAACGTVAYVSPDTLRGGYTNACDMWSLGVIVYMLLVGYPPFGAGDEQEIIRRIMYAKYDMAHRRWKNISDNAKNFVRRLLVADPESVPVSHSITQSRYPTAPRQLETNDSFRGFATSMDMQPGN